MRFFSIWFFLYLTFCLVPVQAQNSVSQRAIELYREGEYKDAIREFRKGIEAGQISKYKGYYFISVVYIKMGQVAKARRILDRLVEKKIPIALKRKVQRQRDRLQELAGQENTVEAREKRLIADAMKDFDANRLGTALEKFEAIQEKYKDQTSLFMIGVIYHKIGDTELSESYFLQVTDSHFQEDIQFLRKLQNQGAESPEIQRLNLSIEFKRGANSNPVLDNDFSDVSIGDNDTESQLEVNGKYTVYQTKNSQLRLEASYYSEDYSFNDGVDSEAIDGGLQWSQSLGGFEVSIAPLYSKQKQDSTDLLESYALYVDFSRPLGNSSEFTLGGSYTDNKPAEGFEFLEGQATTFYGSYLKSWSSSFSNLSLQFFKNALSDEEDLIVSNSGFALSGSFIYTKGKWTFPFSLKYQKKTYVEDTLLSFIRIDKTVTLGFEVQYRLTNYLDLLWENQLSQNTSNLDDETDDRNYKQVRSLVGFKLAY